MKTVKLIDLFSGAGGMTQGFIQAFGENLLPVWANDFDRWAAASYNANFGNHCICGDISELLKNREVLIPRADLVIGGPPCQGFSLLNKGRSNDERRQMWKPFFEVVERSGASVFVMENVPQLLGSEEHLAILEKATLLGFQVVSHKLLAADFGVPQLRWRAFIVGCRGNNPAQHFPPMKSHFDPNSKKVSFFEYDEDPQPWRTVRDAIFDLPAPEGTEIRAEDPPMNLHFGRTPTPMSLRRYAAIPKEGMNRFDLQRNAPELTPGCWIRKTSGGTDLFGRLWWDRPAFTIRTEFFKPEKGRYLHPSQHRPITHREAARLQAFPDSFKFLGTKIEIAKQIGNAVPPLLASKVAQTLKPLFGLEPKWTESLQNAEAA